MTQIPQSQFQQLGLREQSLLSASVVPDPNIRVDIASFSTMSFVIDDPNTQVGVPAAADSLTLYWPIGMPPDSEVVSSFIQFLEGFPYNPSGATGGNIEFEIVQLKTRGRSSTEEFDTVVPASSITKLEAAPIQLPNSIREVRWGEPLFLKLTYHQRSGGPTPPWDNVTTLMGTLHLDITVQRDPIGLAFEEQS